MAEGLRHATLLYNPAAGRAKLQAVTLEAIRLALRSAGVVATIKPTEGPGTAGAQAKEAAKASDLLFACGGDGTVHEVLQGLTGQSETALGVLPFGSANVLARHLQLSLDPVKAAMEQVHRYGVMVPLGRVTFTGRQGEESRFFLAVAGAGADGLLAFRTHAASKRSLGRLAYPIRAVLLCNQGSFLPFRLDSTLADGTTLSTEAVTIMTSRVTSLGGLLRPMVPRGSVLDAHLAVTVVQPPSRLTLPTWFAASWAGMSHRNPWQEHLQVRAVQCGAGRHSPVHVQADGEWLGYTPMRLEVVPEALRLLCPEPLTSQPAR